MMAKKSKAQAKEGKDLLENPEAIAEKISRSEEFLNKNKNAVMAVLGVAVLVIAGFFKVVHSQLKPPALPSRCGLALWSGQYCPTREPESCANTRHRPGCHDYVVADTDSHRSPGKLEQAPARGHP